MPNTHRQFPIVRDLDIFPITTRLDTEIMNEANIT